MKPNKQMRKSIQAGKEYQKASEKKKCIACNGAGQYDVSGSHKCSTCNGKGYTD